MTTTTATPSSRTGTAPGGYSLPAAFSVLAVTARPGQESAELGGLLQAYRRSGADLSLLCLTQGEAAAQNSGSARLEAVRPWETQLAAAILGIGEVAVGNFRDGSLPAYPAAEVAGRIGRAIRDRSADLLLVVDPEAGDQADAAVARAAAAAAATAGIPAVAGCLPGAPGSWTVDLGPDAGTARAIQKSAAAAHASQSAALPAVLGRLDQRGRDETVRWLRFAPPVPAQSGGRPLVTG